MCLNPIRIKNPKFKTGSFDKMHDAYYLTVPCGYCWQCRNRRQNDWILRNYLEYKDTLKNHGVSYYYTLTFDDLHLPRLFGRSCFDSELISKFGRCLHNRLFRLGCKVKYFLVSELGEKWSRPHHHVIFYVTKSNNYKTIVKDKVKYKVLIPYNPPSPHKFYDIVNSCWKNGNVKPGNNFGVVNSPFAIYYCCKYLNKGGKEFKVKAFGNSKNYPRFITMLNSRFGNFVRCSAGLGRNYIGNLTEQEFRDGCITIPVDKKILSFPIPEYFLRKTVKVPFQNANGNISYKLNLKGFEYYSCRYDALYRQLQNRCKLLNEHFDTDFDVDFILHCQLDNSLPKSQLDKSFKELFFQRKYNSEFSNHVYDLNRDEIDDRYYLPTSDIQKYRLFNRLNSQLSYVQYKKHQTSYNLKQKLLYGKTKKLVTIQKFNDYVHLTSQLAIDRENRPPVGFSLAGNFKNYKYFKKIGLCRRRKPRSSVVSTLSATTML